jgi:CheY-like chemotaxis protein
MAWNEERRPPNDIPGVDRNVVAGGEAPTIADDIEDITILFVDDERQLLSVLASNLEENIESLDVVTASNATEAVERLESIAVDCVVSDYKMPGSDGLELLERCRERDPDVPFILFTSKGSEDIASRAIDADVTDYLQKDLGAEQLTLLSNRIKNAVAERRAQAAAEDAVRHLQRIHDRVADGYLGLDEEFHITYLDEEAAVLLEDSRERLLGERLWDVLPEAVDSPLQDEFERALAADTSVELETYYEPYRTWFDVRAFPADGGLSVYFRDVTERKRLESAVEERDADLAAVADAVAEMRDHAGSLLSVAERVDGEDAEDAERLAAGLEKLVDGFDSVESMARE